MATPAQLRANAKHLDKLDVIKVQPYKQDGAEIRAAAAAAGQSLQGYILQAIRERMARDQQQADGAPMPPQNTTD
ncbi:MAG: hypothetical protein LUC06_04850 [Oscillospiraceae bacterium]|nr:hypothetical protein [Oscillospiraceae bacterium]